MRIAKTGKETASWRQTGSDSHHRTARGGRLGLGCMVMTLLLAACDPVTGTGSGTPPDPAQYLKVDASSRSAVVTLIAGYPASDFQFNYDGYTDGALVLEVPIGWQVTVQCANRSTVASSCAVVTDGSATAPIEADWSTPDPRRGLDPGQSASFVFTPRAAGSYRIASLVPGSEASGMWLDLEVVSGGTPSLKGQGS